MKISTLFLTFFLPIFVTKGVGATPDVSYFDLSDERAISQNDPKKLRHEYDEQFLLTSLEGLVNRTDRQLFVRWNPKLDDFWWARMTEKDSWLDGAAVKKIPSLQVLLTEFASSFKGAVVYDGSVPATSNVAATIAGADDLLVLRYDTDPDSLYQQLKVTLPVKVWLIKQDGSPLFTGDGMIPDTSLESTGSAKNDAYRWMIENYLKTGKLEATEIGYYIDSFWLKANPGIPWFGDNLANLDFLIAHRGLVVDLDVFGDELPVDDPKQKMGTDRETLKLIFAEANKQTGGRNMINVHGFVPWAYKYSNAKTASWSAGGNHDPVPSEWTFAQLISNYNGNGDCDAMTDMSNASFYQHFPLPDVIPQKMPRLTKADLIKRGLLTPEGKLLPTNYYAYYVGDYDSAAWLYQYMPGIWPDPARGSIPLAWAINPNLSERFAFGLYWIRKTATENDVFIAGDDGSGYLNPGLLSTPRDSGLPSGMPAWENRNLNYFKQWDLDTVGFIIDGYSGFMKPEGLDAYAKFAPGGIVSQFPPPTAMHEGMPLLQMSTDLDAPITAHVEKSAGLITKFFAKDGPHFIVGRSILWRPTDHIAVSKQIDKTTDLPHQLVDLRTILQLYKYAQTGTMD
jgi:GxGYxYP putative glycoside hydrolase C-terminal domain/GxGYxY sequence motif in domain of unknown function N-terminal